MHPKDTPGYYLLEKEVFFLMLYIMGGECRVIISGRLGEEFGPGSCRFELRIKN
jgi:hypothetical protein